MIHLARTWGIAATAAGILVAPAGLASDELGSSMTIEIVRAVLALILVLALFFLFVYLIRRYYPRALEKFPGGPGRAEQIEIRATRALGPKRTLYLVRTGKRNYLIGATDQTINPIDQWMNDLDDLHGSPTNVSGIQSP